MRSAAASTVEIVNVTRNTIVAANGRRADSFLARGRGLMLEPNLDAGSGLIIDPCSSIHMFFMRFPIDVVYVSRDGLVVRVQENLKPWRIGPLYTRDARYVVELPTGTVAATKTSVGDQITVRVPN